MQTLDEMLALSLLTPAQHAQIHAWAHHAKTPERIMNEMPAHLWRALELASVLMDFDVGLAGAPGH
ncbi:hypothetical protein [Paucibacter soli]|uniref:hypothetical protein n=1 Tax=Paucibacter soli TaxID=3133433 RepID=UPI0030A94690